MDVSIGPRVGETAPRLSLRSSSSVLTLESLDGQPAVVAFFDSWSPLQASFEELGAVRAELRGLGAVLIVLSRDGLFVFRPDDEVERFADADDLDQGDVAAAHAAFGLERCAFGLKTPALFVVDGKGVLRFAHRWPASRAGEEVGLEQLGVALGAAGRAVLSSKRSLLLTRRELVATSLVAGFALVFLDACDKPKDPGAPGGDASLTSAEAGAAPATVGEGEIELTLDVNGTARKVKVDPRTTLLDALRERMGLPGSKKGCDHGQCGACTVHVDGRRVNSCLLFASMVEGKKIVTIEGLAKGDDLHPMQAAFVAEDALQCGYCTPGQIMSAVALLQEGNAKSDVEVRESMSGNICRCGAYTNIVSAIQRARKGAA